MTTDIDLRWLPIGQHYDLNISHKVLQDAGEFTGGGWKICWHTVESPQQYVTRALEVLRTKKAGPHFIYGYDYGHRYPDVIQCIPLDRAARSLQHTEPPETNRANVISIEVCGRAVNSALWSDNYYRGLANLVRLIEHRVRVPRKMPKRFIVPAKRFKGNEFVVAEGHVGHCHVPGNNHWDPGYFRCKHLLNLLETGVHVVNPRSI